MDGGVETEVKCRVRKVSKVFGDLRKIFKHRALGKSVKRGLHKERVVSTVLCMGLKHGAWQ